MTEHKIQLLIQPKNTQEFIEDNYINLKFKTGYKTEYQFTIIIPKKWKEYPSSISKYPSPEIPVAMIAKIFNTEKSSSADIEIWSTKLPREIHPSDWLHLWIETQGYTIQDSRTIPSSYGLVGDCVAQKYIENQLYTCRIFAFKDKNRLFFLIAKTLAANYKIHEESFLLAIQSFSLINPTKELYAEPFVEKKVNLPYQALLRHPQQWKERIETPESKTETSISFINKEGDIVLGQINIVLLSKITPTSPRKMLDTWLTKLDLNHILVDKNTNIDVKQIEHKTLATWKGEGKSGNTSIELHSNMINHSQGMLMINLITPPAIDNYEVWAVNRRSYEIIFGTAQY